MGFESQNKMGRGFSFPTFVENVGDSDNSDSPIVNS